MKVGLVCPYDLGAPGGVQDQVVRLSHWLADAGHDAIVVGPGTDGPAGSVVLGSTVTVPANRSAVPVGLDPRMSSRLREALAGCDVVHVHEPLMPMVSLAAARMGEVPTVGTFHADPSATMRRALRLYRYPIRRALGRLDVITAVSTVASSAVPLDDPVEIIPNGVDIDAYRTGPKQPAAVAFLGRDDPRKGLSTLIEAWPAIRAANPDAELLVAGAHRDEAVEGVTWLGRVSEDDKIDVLARAEVFVAPNTGGESFGIILVEAMAAGCAVVASAIPAFTRVLAGAGVHVQPGDADGLGDAVARLLRDDTRRSELAERSRVRAQDFDGAVIARQYEAAYVKAIARHGR